jgi:hypothetical protein
MSQRFQFSLRWLLLATTGFCMLAAAAPLAWRLVRPIIDPPYRKFSWTVMNGGMVEHHTEWSDGRRSVNAFPEPTYRPINKSEFEAAVRKASGGQAWPCSEPRIHE